MTSSDDDVITTETVNVLSADEIAEAYQTWQAPRMVSVTDVESPDSMLTVEAIEALQKEAQEEGYKAGFEKGHQSGYDAGFQTGQADVQQQIATLQSLIESLNHPLQHLDEEVEKSILSLVITMAKQLLLHELRTEPELVLKIMRASLATLPVNDRKVKVFAHPDDVALIRSALSLESDDKQWQWIEDPLLTRGGLRLETADTTVDATVESRLKTLIDQMLANEEQG